IQLAGGDLDEVGEGELPAGGAVGPGVIAAAVAAGAGLAAAGGVLHRVEPPGDGGDVLVAAGADHFAPFPARDSRRLSMSRRAASDSIPSSLASESAKSQSLALWQSVRCLWRASTALRLFSGKARAVLRAQASNSWRCSFSVGALKSFLPPRGLGSRYSALAG